MGRKRVYEIARDQGLSTGELLARLREAGIEVPAAVATVEENEALEVLGNGDRRAREKPVRDARPPSPKPPPAKPSRNGSAPRRSWIERLAERRRLWDLRRRRTAQLADLGGLVAEMYRSGSKRSDLVEERLKVVAQGERELRRLEEQLGDRRIGGACPNCGLYARDARFCLACGQPLKGEEAVAPGSPTAQRLSIPAALLVIVLIAGAWLLGGIGSSKKERSFREILAAGRGYESLVANAKASRIGIYKSIGAPVAYTHLKSPNADGAPLVFLVKEVRSNWLQVYLPGRPNGSLGWIRVPDVTLAGHDYRMLIDTKRHRLMAWKGRNVIANVPVGVGRAVTPTPAGQYYITELLKQPDPTGLYGPYAFGMSAHSDVLNEFAGADGILGIHGTNYPRGIGTNVSHGCIRMSNANIIKLAKTVPVGTPVQIKT